MKQIPVLDLQGMLSNQEKSEFQDTIETLALKLKDQEESTKRAQDLILRLLLQISGLQANMTGHTTLMNDRNAAVSRCT